MVVLKAVKLLFVSFKNRFLPLILFTMHILVIDNYDSFTYNLIHMLDALDLEYSVRQNDSIVMDELDQYSHLLISPGPGIPKEAGQLIDVLNHWPKDKPMLGVCLGMQAMLTLEGGKLRNLTPVHHGSRKEMIALDQSDLFFGLPEQFAVGRYHSWGFYKDGVPSTYTMTATDDDQLVMAVTHIERPWFGVQFHPESIMTAFGMEILKNFFNAGQRKNQKSEALSFPALTSHSSTSA